jgi:membrane-associated protease RseP (regulator of RpoE activity)
MGELFFKSWGWTAYLAFVWIIALALAIFNLLPIPALDGGSGICLILQAIFKISHEKYLKYIGYINAFFFWSLMILWIVIILKDLVTYWGLPLPFIA